MFKKWFCNVDRLVKVILRRDKIRLPVWVGLIVVTTLLIAFVFPGLYPDEVERQSMAIAMENPAMIAMFGPNFAGLNYTYGAMFANQMLWFTMILVAIMSIMFVTRHTRADEEEGILEVIRSYPVGRLSNVMATLLVIIGVHICLALILGFGIGVMPIETYDFAGALTFGFAVGGTGILMAAITAIFVQLFESNRAAMGFSFLTLGVMYILRGIGDVSSEVLAWSVPLNWLLRTEAFVSNQILPLFMALVLSLVFILIAFVLNARRDLEAGILPQKSGASSASAYLKTSFGLTLRLTRTTLIAWGITMLLLGLSYGVVFGDLDAFFEANEQIQNMLPGGSEALVEQFLAVVVSVIAVTAPIASLTIINRLVGEEKKNRSEPLFASPISRTKILGGTMIIAIVALVLLLVLGVLGLYLGMVSSMDEPLAFMTVMTSGLVYLPAMGVMLGIAVVLVGWFPLKTGLVWAYLGISFFVIYMGGMLQLPNFVVKLTPYGFVPKYPIETLSPLSPILLIILTVGLIMLGWTGYKRRDLLG